jgi:hypothetical protein
MIPDKPQVSWVTRITLGVFVVLAAVLITLKLGLFFGFEYTSDLFVHIEKSRSFLLGKPLLYDNIHGPHPFHNTLVELLFAPFTWFWGALGLLVPYLLFLVGSFYAVLRWADRLQPYARAHVVTFLFAGLMGPVGFWMLDNPIYGWHPEMMAFPLALLLAVGLVREHTLMVRLSAVGMVLTHELGAVVCGCIFLLHYTIVKAPHEKSWLGMFKRQLLIVLPWIALFFAGLVLQHYWDPVGAGRLSGVLRQLREQASREDVGVMLTRLWWLLCTCGFVFFLFPLRPKAFLATLAACAPLILATTAAGFAYTVTPSKDTHNVFWPPRFAFTWGILAAGVIFSYATVQQKQASRWVWLKLAPLAAALVYAQMYAVFEIRGYSVVERAGLVIHGRTHHAKFTPEELRVLDCIERQTPKTTPVYLSPFLWNAFHTHQIHQYRPDNPLRLPPEITICDDPNRDWIDRGSCKKIRDEVFPANELREVKAGGLEISYREPHAAVVMSCVEPRKRP